MEAQIIQSNLSKEDKLILIYLNHVHNIFEEYKKFNSNGFVPVMVFEKENLLADSYDLAMLNQQFFTSDSMIALKNYSEFRYSNEMFLNEILPNINYSSYPICPNQGIEEENKFIQLLKKINAYDKYCALLEKNQLEANITSNKPQNQRLKI
jgi:hypothetical protein